MKVVCAWCKKELGEKEGKGVSHGICKPCKERLLEIRRALDSSDFRRVRVEDKT